MTAEAEALVPMAELADRWAVTPNTVSRRLAFLGIKPIFEVDLRRGGEQDLAPPPRVMAESDRPGTAFANLAVVRVSVIGGQEACGISLASDAVEASNPSTKAPSDKVDLARGDGERDANLPLDAMRDHGHTDSSHAPSGLAPSGACPGQALAGRSLRESAPMASDSALSAALQTPPPSRGEVGRGAEPKSDHWTHYEPVSHSLRVRGGGRGVERGVKDAYASIYSSTFDWYFNDKHGLAPLSWIFDPDSDDVGVVMKYANAGANGEHPWASNFVKAAWKKVRKDHLPPKREAAGTEHNGKFSL